MFHTSERPGGVAVSARPADPRVSVVVPARDQARVLDLLLPALPPVHEVILVDGGSADDTVATARRQLPDVRVTRQRHRDEGHALAAGLAEVTGDVVVLLDAGTSADPGEIPRLVAALVDGADVASGSRLPADRGHDGAGGRRLGDAVLNRIARRVLGQGMGDLHHGFDAFWADLLPVLVPSPDLGPARGRVVWGDVFEVERTAIRCRLAAAEAAVAEVPTTQLSRGRGDGSVRSLLHGLRLLPTLVTESRRIHSADHLVVRRPECPGQRQRLALVSSGRVSP